MFTISRVSILWSHITPSQLSHKSYKNCIKRFRHASGTDMYNQLWMWLILMSVLESHNKLLVLQEIHAPALSNDHDQRVWVPLNLRLLLVPHSMNYRLLVYCTQAMLAQSAVSQLCIWSCITTGQLTCKLSKIHIKRFKHASGTGTYRQLWTWLIFILPSPWSTVL
jgi:hypothetical protein